MAISIPTQDGPGVQNRALPAPQIQSVGPDMSGARLQQQVLGAAGQLAQAEFDRADNAAIMDAESKLSQTKLDLMFNPEGGVYARKGKDALDITNQTLPQFDKQAEQIGMGLTNQRQKDQFARIVNRQRLGLNGELNNYEHTQRNAFYDQADTTNITTSMDGAVKYANDPDQVAYYRSKGSFVIGEMGRRKGLPPETIADQQNKFDSSVNMNVIERLVTADPLQAQQYYAKSADTMTAEDQLKSQKLLGTAVRQQMAVGIANSIYDSGQIGDAGLLWLIIQAETGGNQNAVSPKGAVGLMQLMPETAEEMSKKLGIPYSKERLAADPNYNAALGTAYLNEMLGRFDGNQTMAVAAYNAGPGMVEDWVNGTNKTGKNPSKVKLPDPRTSAAANAEFIQKIPFEETRNYTSSIMSKALPTVPASQKYANGLEQANAINDPQLKKFVLDQLDDRKKAAEAQSNALYDQAAKYVYYGGFSTIPAQLINNLPGDELIKLQRMDDYRRKGTEPKTDYTKLQNFLQMPTAKLASLGLEKDIRPYLSNTDYKTVQNAWQKAQNGDGTAQQISAGKEKVIQTTMQLAGIDTGDNAKAKIPANIEKQDQFRFSLQERMDSFTSAHGREPNVMETEDLARKLLLKVRLTGGGMLYGDSGTKDLWTVRPEELDSVYLDQASVEFDKIPWPDRAVAIKQLKIEGKPASQANIRAKYVNRISELGVKIK